MEHSPSETVAASSPPKKKRGRPKKADKQFLLQNEANVAPAKDAPMRVRRKRKKGFLKSVTAASHGRKKIRVQQGVLSPSTSKISDSDGDDANMTAPAVAEKQDVNVGQQVHGVVDGMFDAGYLVTVRVGDTETVFRGVVFGPGLSLPLNKENDVAPKLKRMTSQLDTPDVHVITPTLNDQEAPAVAAFAHAPANSASISTALNATANEAVTMAVGRAVPQASPAPATSIPPPPSAYSPAATYRSPLFGQRPLQNASGGFYYAPPAHSPNPNANAYYPPRGFPAYAFQYPAPRAEYHTEFAGPAAAAAASDSSLPNMQGTLPPRAS